MNRFRIVSSLIESGVIILITCLPAFGQAKVGTVRGSVIDLESKDSLYGAIAVLRTPNGQHTLYGAATDRSGHFQIRNIQPGTYKLMFSSIGYRGDSTATFTITADTVLDFMVELDPYFGPNAEDAHRDLDSGKVQIYLVSWPLYSKEQADLAKHYGFEIASTGCIPMWTSRYDSVVINYLKHRNGEHWYATFLREWDRLREEDLKNR